MFTFDLSSESECSRIASLSAGMISRYDREAGCWVNMLRKVDYYLEYTEYQKILQQCLTVFKYIQSRFSGLCEADY